MEAISLKLDKTLLNEIDSNLHKHRYSTRTEFIRDSIRRRLSDLEKDKLLKLVDKMHGSSKKKTTDEELHEAGEIAFKQLEEKFK
jgi:metal-responsive CopG/Arc/MetJ family transcriptional regulator